MSEIELKACPFCGADGKSLVIEHMEGTIRHPAYCVRCDNCGASSRYTDHDCREVWNERAPQWQPIESAPKDGAFYLATNGKDQRVENCPEGHVAGIWHRIDGDWRGSALGDDSTYWQPLPAPPEVSA